MALDLDGTLLRSDGVLSARSVEAIRAAENCGVLVTIATGRRFRDALPVALEAKINAPLLTHNGALLKYADTLETVNAALLPPETARKTVEIGDAFGAEALVSCDPHTKGFLFYDKIGDDNVPLQKYIVWAKRLHGAEAEDSIIHVECLKNIVAEHETVHISFSGTCAKMAQMQNLLETELGGKAKIMATVYPSLDFTLLDILNAEASKGYGLRKLCEINEILPREVMVCGDNFNDLEMLEFAGTPVVMGNAAPEMIENPRYFETLSNDEDGVAAAIEKFILKTGDELSAQNGV